MCGEILGQASRHPDRDGKDRLVEVTALLQDDLVGIGPGAPVRLKRRRANRFGSVELVGQRFGGKALEPAVRAQRVIAGCGRAQLDLDPEADLGDARAVGRRRQLVDAMEELEAHAPLA